MKESVLDSWFKLNCKVKQKNKSFAYIDSKTADRAIFTYDLLYWPSIWSSIALFEERSTISGRLWKIRSHILRAQESD